MILPAQDIRRLCSGPKPLITPFSERAFAEGFSYGLGPAGYDVRLAEDRMFGRGGFQLGSTIEHFDIPDDLMMSICDKSSWARKGLSVFNSRGEPGWRGFLTIEMVNHTPDFLKIKAGTPIAHIVFERLSAPTEQPYEGRYQDQRAGPQPAIPAVAGKDV